MPIKGMHYFKAVRIKDGMVFTIDKRVMDAEPHLWRAYKESKNVTVPTKRVVVPTVGPEPVEVNDEENDWEGEVVTLPTTAEEYREALDKMGVTYHSQLGLAKLSVLWNDNQEA